MARLGIVAEDEFDRRCTSKQFEKWLAYRAVRIDQQRLLADKSEEW